MSTPITERSRTPWPARAAGVSTFALATACGWIVAFGLIPIPGWNWPILETSKTALSTLGRAMLEISAPYLSLIADWLPKAEPVMAILHREHTVAQFFVRVALVGVAGLAAANSIHRWRLKKTPRCLGTKWLGVDFPRWSEGRDAVVNANLAMAKPRQTSGSGLEIAPGVALSRDIEARAILIVGDPGSGKTVSFWWLLFQLRKRNGRLVIHDFKGDMTARWPENFILLAPHDVRSCGWAIGQDIVGENLTREFAAQLIPANERAPNWANGAREIFVGVVLTLQRQKRTDWSWAELKTALDLPDAELREFASRHNPAAARFLALGDSGEFTLNAGSYVSTLMAPVNELVAPLAKAWGDLDSQYTISLKEWLDDPEQDRRTLILQRAADLPAMSTAWIGTAIKTMTLHLLASRSDSRTSDDKSDKPQLPEVWFGLDEFPQLGIDPKSFLPLLETGRSLGLRSIIAVQNFESLSRVSGSSDFAGQLTQLAGTLLAFRLNPGADSAQICESRLTKAKIRTYVDKEVNGKTQTKPASEEIAILTQDDLSELELTRDGAPGYLIFGNSAFGLAWPFSENPEQRPGKMRAAWLDEE